jgi:hypothetical protein
LQLLTEVTDLHSRSNNPHPASLHSPSFDCQSEMKSQIAANAKMQTEFKQVRPHHIAYRELQDLWWQADLQQRVWEKKGPSEIPEVGTYVLKLLSNLLTLLFQAKSTHFQEILNSFFFTAKDVISSLCLMKLSTKHWQWLGHLGGNARNRAFVSHCCQQSVPESLGFSYHSQNSSNLCPLPNSKVISTFLNVCCSRTSPPGTKICISFLPLL